VWKKHELPQNEMWGSMKYELKRQNGIQLGGWKKGGSRARKARTDASRNCDAKEGGIQVVLVGDRWLSTQLPFSAALEGFVDVG
jgi:hypothetical protein